MKPIAFSTLGAAALVCLTSLPLRTQDSLNASTAKIIRLLENAKRNAQAHGAQYMPLLSPSDELLRGPNAKIDFKAVQRAGYAVIPWTIDDTARMRELIGEGVHGIISDRPDLLHSELEQAKRSAKGPRDAAYLSSFDAEGHRGARDLRPENTLPAFEAGLDNLITTIETDTGVTADHVSLISHEHFINPQTCRAADGSNYTPANRVFIKDITMAEAQKRFICDRVFRGPQQRNDVALSPVSVAFAKEHGLISPYVPTNVQQLYRFVNFYAGYYREGPGQADPKADMRCRNARKVRFNLETKVDPRAQSAGDTFGPEVFVHTLCQSVAANHMEERSDIQSFDFRTLLLAQREYPKIPTVFLVEEWNLADQFVPAEFRNEEPAR